MSQQTINIGTSANDGTGDALRVAGQKINSNFTEVYNTSAAAFNKANTANNLAQAAFNYANTIVSDTQIDPYARTTANAAFNTGNSSTILAQAGFNQANTANTTAQAGFNQANTANTTAQAGFDQANTANTTAQAGFNFANTIANTAQAGFNQANTANTTAQAGFDKANTANTTAQAGFDKANTFLYKAVTTISSGGNTNLTLNNEVVMCDPNAASANINIVLPATPVSGKVITVKNINTGANVVYVQPSGGSDAMELLSGTVGTGIYETLSTSGNTVTWIWDSSCWRIISSY